MKKNVLKVIITLLSLCLVVSAAAIYSSGQTASGTLIVCDTDISQGGYWNVTGTDEYGRTQFGPAIETDYDMYYNKELNLLVLNYPRFFSSDVADGTNCAIYADCGDLTVQYNGYITVGYYQRYSDGTTGSLSNGIKVYNGSLTLTQGSAESELVIQINGKRTSVNTKPNNPLYNVNGCGLYASDGVIIDKNSVVTINTPKITYWDGEQKQGRIGISVGDGKETVEIRDNANVKVNWTYGDSAIRGEAKVYVDAKLYAGNEVDGNLWVNGGTAEIKGDVTGNAEIRSGYAYVKGSVGGTINVQSLGELDTATRYNENKVTLGEGINVLHGAQAYSDKAYNPRTRYTLEEGIKVFIDNKPYISVYPYVNDEGFIWVDPNYDAAIEVSCSTGDYKCINADNGKVLKKVKMNTDTPYECDGVLLGKLGQDTHVNIVPETQKATDLYIGSAKINTQTGLVESGTAEHSYSYNPETNTLTLNNMHITADFGKNSADGKNYYSGIFSNADLIIKLIGENSIEVPWDPGYEGYGIYTAGVLILEGDGSLEITAQAALKSVTGIYTGKQLSVDKATLNIAVERPAFSSISDSNSIGIRGSLRTYGCTLDIKVADGKQSVGIYSVSAGSNIKNSFVTVSTGKADSDIAGAFYSHGYGLVVNGKQRTQAAGVLLEITPESYDRSPSRIYIGDQLLFCSREQTSAYGTKKIAQKFDTYEYCTMEDGVLVPCTAKDDWRIHYDFRTNTLELRGFEYTANEKPAILADGILNVNLFNTNTLTSNDEYHAINALNKLNFSGTGSLVVRAKGNSTARALCVGKTQYLYDIYSTDFTGETEPFSGEIIFPKSSRLGGATTDSSNFVFYVPERVSNYRAVSITGTDNEFAPEYTSVYVFFHYGFDGLDPLKVKTLSTGKLGEIPEPPVREDYRFLGWYTAGNDPDLPGVKVTENTKFISDYTDVYARWEKITLEFEITFDAKGGTVLPETATTNEYGFLYDLPTPEREGYIFDGWYLDNDDKEDPVTSETKFYSQTTIYAHWKKGVTVTFDPNGGTVDKIYDTTNEYYYLYSLPMPSRDGYSFDGWFTAPEGGEIITSETKFKTATTVYARWTKLPDEPATDEPTTDEPSTGENPTEPNTPPDDTPTDSWFIRFLKAIQNFFTKIITWLQALFSF